MKDWQNEPITWERTDDFEFPYAAAVGEQKLTVRVNEWPDYPAIYTLIVDEEEIADFDDWPEAWTRPAAEDADLPGGEWDGE